MIYGALEQLSRGKLAVTAYEPDGRQYCPAIIRAHYDGYTYKPHFDSVRLREKRENYSVSAFEHQFAGVLVLQNAQRGDRSAQAVIHRCLWNSQVDPHIQKGTFHEYAETNQIDNLEVCLEPGDLYFFNTRSIHEVPGLDGELPRIVVAVFIGFSSDREEDFLCGLETGQRLDECSVLRAHNPEAADRANNQVTRAHQQVQPCGDTCSQYQLRTAPLD